MPNQKIAVVLFNLGGPDSPDAVRPFLFNLFNDPAIIASRACSDAAGLSAARRRAKPAGEIYQILGGKSPLLENTEAQAGRSRRRSAIWATSAAFIAMRYWHPMSDETAEQVQAVRAGRMVLLPLYPQFSTTTTASSQKMWFQAAKWRGWTSRRSRSAAIRPNRASSRRPPA